MLTPQQETLNMNLWYSFSVKNFYSVSYVNNLSIELWIRCLKEFMKVQKQRFYQRLSKLLCGTYSSEG